MITQDHDIIRILSDVDVAIEMLNSIKYVCKRDNMISEQYLSEKSKCALDCCKFLNEMSKDAYQIPNSWKV